MFIVDTKGDFALWENVLNFFFELIKEGDNFFSLEHVRNNGAVAHTDFERSINFCDGSLRDFDGVGYRALGITFHEHVGDGEAFAKHDLFDRGEEVIEEIGSFLG